MTNGCFQASGEGYCQESAFTANQELMIVLDVSVAAYSGLNPLNSNGQGVLDLCCWHASLPRLLNFQNWLYIRRDKYLGPCKADQNHVAGCLRPYWGWNEVPIMITQADGVEASNTIDIFSIFLPLGASDQDTFNAVCDLSSRFPLDCATNLGDQMYTYMRKGLLVPGRRNVVAKLGSNVVFVTQDQRTEAPPIGPPNYTGSNYKFRFSCQEWTVATSQDRGMFHTKPYGTGGCFICYQPPGHSPQDC